MESTLLSPAESAWYTTTLPDACPQAVIKAVRVLAAAAREAMHANSFRWQYPDLYVAELTRETRPLYVRDCPHRLIGIYDRLPSYGCPLGSRLFVVGFPDDGRCEECGSCRTGGNRPLTVGVRLDRRFPLDFQETCYEFGKQFGVIDWRIFNTHPEWLGASAPQGEPQPEPDPEPERRAGAPLCLSTQKLLAAMERLENPRSYRHLKPQWLAWYIEEHGDKPSDEDGSFRHAANTCLRIIERRRGGERQRGT